MADHEAPAVQQTHIPAAKPPNLGPRAKAGGPAPKASSWAEESAAELTAAGWESAGTDERGNSTWLDPRGAGQKRGENVRLTLPAKGGGVEVFEQCHIPPASWAYSTEDALLIQRQREGGGEASVIDRLNALGTRYDIVNDTLTKLLKGLERIVARQVPEKPDNVRRELAETKTQIIDMLGFGRQALEKARPVDGREGGATEKAKDKAKG